jgi:hypothetical protein
MTRSFWAGLGAAIYQSRTAKKCSANAKDPQEIALAYQTKIAKAELDLAKTRWEAKRYEAGLRPLKEEDRKND